MSSINTASMIRGADGRLFAVSADGVKEIFESAASVNAAVRAGKENQDHQAGRFAVTPGV